MRIKAVVISIAGIVVFLLLYLIFATLPDKGEKSGEDVVLRSEIKSGYTLDEMMKKVKNENIRSYKVETSTLDSSENNDLQRIQKLIQENEKAFQDPVPQGNFSVATSKNKKNRRAKDSVSVKDSNSESRLLGRREFNSIRLVKEDETNAIKAFVHSTQVVMVGSTLKMQLSENCLTDDGQRIRKGTPVYGEVTAIDGERVIVKISSININNNILPFKKKVFSRDAIEGIYVPGNPKSDITKEATSSAVTGANTNITGGLDIGTQLVAGAANSVISATKSATSNNIRKIKVTIKTNYQILLMEDEQ